MALRILWTGCMVQCKSRFSLYTAGFLCYRSYRVLGSIEATFLSDFSSLSVAFQPVQIKLISIGIRTPVTVGICCSGEEGEYRTNVWPLRLEKDWKSCLCAKIPENMGLLRQISFDFTAFHGWTEVKIGFLTIISTANSRVSVPFRPRIASIPPTAFYPLPPSLLQKRLSDWYPTLKPRRKLA